MTFKIKVPSFLLDTDIQTEGASSLLVLMLVFVIFAVLERNVDDDKSYDIPSTLTLKCSN